MNCEDLEVNECTVNSSDLAAHADENVRSEPGLIHFTVRTRGVTALFGEKIHCFLIKRCSEAIHDSYIFIPISMGSLRLPERTPTPATLLFLQSNKLIQAATCPQHSMDLCEDGLVTYTGIRVGVFPGQAI